MSTYSIPASKIQKNWLLIDADGLVLGRLSAKISTLLRGKHKVDYTPHMDCGDCIIVINAEKIFLSGSKLRNKVYYRHTGYPGGIKSTTTKKILDGPIPERVLRKSVERMMGHGILSRKRLKNLYVYTGKEHPHAGQQPVTLDFASLNIKNSFRRVI